jgi:archaemetzincin
MRWLALAALGTPAEDVMRELVVAVAATYGLPVRRTPDLPVPQEGLDPSRGQWSSAEMLKTLITSCPPRADWILGVTQQDLYVPVLTFVYGQAQLRGRAAVVSLARLRPEFYGLPGDPGLLVRRAIKEAVHELGHVFGLVHCLDRRCPMSLSVGLDELDFKTAEPCASCSALLEGSRDMPRRRLAIHAPGEEP